MNKSIILSLKRRSKFTVRYQNNLSSYNLQVLFNQVRECTTLITKAKERYIATMSTKLDKPETAPKTYW